MNRQQADHSQRHDRILELAATAVDFDLTAAESAEFETHLATCAACARRASGIRADARLLGLGREVLPSPRVDAAIRAAIARRRDRPAGWLLLVAAALLLVALMGVMAVGAALLRTPETLPVTVVPNPSVPVAIVSQDSVPSASVDALPTPKCPAPPEQVAPPAVSASVGRGQVVVATPGSYTTTTCSTVGTAEAVPKSPDVSLAAYPGDTIELTVPVGWRFVHWEGSHASLVGGGGGGDWAATDLPDKPRSIELSGPLLTDEVVSLTVVLVSDDERTLIELDLQLMVNQSVS